MADSASLSPAKRPRKIDFELNLACLNNEEGFALGEPIPTIPWRFVDDRGGSAFLFGSFVLRLLSPDELVIKGLRKWTISEEAAKQLPPNEYCHSIHKWRAFPTPALSEGGLFLSPADTVTKDVKVTVGLFEVDHEGHYMLQIGNDQYITMRFRAGGVHTISVLSPIVGYMGEDLPSISLACYDEWGNRTAPGKDEIWLVTIDENIWVAGAQPQGYPVLSLTGEARLTGLRLTASGRQIPTEGQCVRISMRLVCRTCRKEGAATQNSLTCSMDVTVMPPETPANGEVGFFPS
jgi:hypothetical protein